MLEFILLSILIFDILVIIWMAFNIFYYYINKTKLDTDTKIAKLTKIIYAGIAVNILWLISILLSCAFQ